MKASLCIASRTEEAYSFYDDDSQGGNVAIAACELSFLLGIDLDAAIELFTVDDRPMVELENMDASIVHVACRLFGRFVTRPIDSRVHSFIAKRLHVYAEGALFHICDQSITFRSVLELFPSVGNLVNLILAVNGNAGELFRDEEGRYDDNGVRYFIRSREAGKHHKPHVHVVFRHEGSASIDIATGEILERGNGKFPSKRLRAARKRILDNKRRLLEYWNVSTDGLEVDLNVLFGKTGFDGDIL